MIEKIKDNLSVILLLVSLTIVVMTVIGPLLMYFPMPKGIENPFVTFYLEIIKSDIWILNTIIATFYLIYRISKELSHETIMIMTAIAVWVIWLFILYSIWTI